MRRPSYEKIALGFVGLCVAGMYVLVTFNPLRPAVYSIEDQALPQAPAVDVQGRAEHGARALPEPSVVEGSTGLSLTKDEGGGAESALEAMETPESPAGEGVSAAEDETDQVSSLVSPRETAWPENLAPDPVEVAPGLGRKVKQAVKRAEERTDAMVVEEARVAFIAPPLPGRKPAVQRARPAEPRNVSKNVSKKDLENAPDDEALAVSRPLNGAAVKGIDTPRSPFVTIGYSLDHVRDGEKTVPRIFLSQLPRELVDVSSPSTRKAIFLKTMLPLVLQVNESVLIERRRLVALRELTKVGGTVSEPDRLWIKEMVGRYDADEEDIEALLTRVDIVPPSLALAQAAEESGWGTSRFAQKGNAPFGVRGFDETTGIVPRERSDGEAHVVKAYDRLLDGVRAYVHNLNIHRAYREFRAARKAMRQEGQQLNGYTLAETLTRYSERGKDYVSTLHLIMLANDLSPLDGSRLNEAQMTTVAISEG